jgi:2'-5' RNA ligase
MTVPALQFAPKTSKGWKFFRRFFQSLEDSLAMSDVARVFVALEITDEVRERIGTVQQRLKAVGAHVGWVLPENIHLTVAFLGDVFESVLPVLAVGLDEAVAAIPAFTLTVQGLGTFGPPRVPRVVWAGMAAPPPGIFKLHEAVAGVLKASGIAVEDRPFAPHLTLGRVRSPKGAGALTSELASIKNTAFGDVRVVRLLLMRSHLEQPRARYSVLHASSLKGT